MHTHIIRTPNHEAFLNENRSDPITGDEIQEGDEIVFCAVCKSAFLKDTWIYLDKTHCNQTETLGKFPSSEKLEISGVSRPALYVITCNDKISTSFNDDDFLNPSALSNTINKRSFYQKNSFSIWIIFISIFLIVASILLHLQTEIVSLGVTFIAIMSIGIKNMFYKNKKIFANSDTQKEIESIQIHSKYISIRFKDTKKDIRIILKSILAINLIYGKSYSFQIIKKGNQVYQFSTSLSSVNQINQLLHSLVQLDEKINIFVRNLPYDDRLKLRKWETENENVLLY